MILKGVIFIVAFLIIMAILILLFSVRVFVHMELKDELKLWINAFGIKIGILPKKEKKYKISDYTLKKIAKRDAKAKKLAEKKARKDAEKKAKKKAKKDAEAKLTKEEKKAIKKKKKESRPAITDLIGMFASIAGLFFKTLFAHFHLKTYRVRIIVGASDASQVPILWYGMKVAGAGLISLLDNYSNLHGKDRADIVIEPSYTAEKIELDLKLSFSMSLFGLLCVVFKVAFKALVKWIKIQPEPKPKQVEATAPKATISGDDPTVASDSDGSANISSKKA